MKIKFIFAWYDLWIGFYWDKNNKCLYVFPVPMFGFFVKFGCVHTWIHRDFNRIEYYICTKCNKIRNGVNGMLLK